MVLPTRGVTLKLCYQARFYRNLCTDLCSAIDDHRITIPNIRQWGYKKGLSTELLLVYLTEKWKMEMDRGKFVGIILIDFRKAFDTVDHSIMQLKLQGAGLANGVAEWINDYLSDRQQFTEINEEKSELQGITHGVPQGSLLGPRLFSIYVEDFPLCTSQGEIELYADDTTAYCTGNSIDEVHVSLEKMLKDIQCWCTRHKLTIHTGKTKVLLINRQKFIGPLNELKLGDTPIEYVAEAKCLGVTLDQKLSWRPQINYVTKSFNAKNDLMLVCPFSAFLKGLIVLLTLTMQLRTMFKTPSKSETGRSRVTKAIVSPAVCVGFSMEMTLIAVNNKRQIYAHIKDSTVVV